MRVLMIAKDVSLATEPYICWKRYQMSLSKEPYVCRETCDEISLAKEPYVCWERGSTFPRENTHRALLNETCISERDVVKGSYSRRDRGDCFFYKECYVYEDTPRQSEERLERERLLSLSRLSLVGDCFFCNECYGVAMISRLLKFMGLFCRISSLL